VTHVVFLFEPRKHGFFLRSVETKAHPPSPEAVSDQYAEKNKFVKIFEKYRKLWYKCRIDNSIGSEVISWEALSRSVERKCESTNTKNCGTRCVISVVAADRSPAFDACAAADFLLSLYRR